MTLDEKDIEVLANIRIKALALGISSDEYWMRIREAIDGPEVDAYLVEMHKLCLRMEELFARRDAGRKATDYELDPNATHDRNGNFLTGL